jgi:hypothetical protein
VPASTAVAIIISNIHKKKGSTIDIETLQNRLLNVCYVPTTSASLNRLLFFFLLQLLTVLMKQTRQVVHTIKQSMLLRCLWAVHTINQPI